MSDQINHKKVWAAGFHAGRQHEREASGEMNQNKIDRKLGGVTKVAHKVYDCVPRQDAWTANQVMQELKRQGYQYSISSTAGCLKSLIETGLVREPKPGLFQQITPGNKPDHEQPKLVVDKNPEPVRMTPEEQIDDIAKRLNALAEDGKRINEDAGLMAIELQDLKDKIAGRASDMQQLELILQRIASGSRPSA